MSNLVLWYMYGAVWVGDEEEWVVRCVVGLYGRLEDSLVVSFFF